MPPDAPLVEEWLRKARRDLYMAALAAQNPAAAPDAWGFHCQQAAEKALKAFLHFHEREVERTHDVDFLVLECSAIDPAFGAWSEVAGMLTAFAVQYRYPGPADPTEEKLREAMRAAESLVVAVEVRVRPSSEE